MCWLLLGAREQGGEEHWLWMQFRSLRKILVSTVQTNFLLHSLSNNFSKGWRCRGFHIGASISAIRTKDYFQWYLVRWSRWDVCLDIWLVGCFFVIWVKQWSWYCCSYEWPSLPNGLIPWWSSSMLGDESYVFTFWQFGESRWSEYCVLVVWWVVVSEFCWTREGWEVKYEWWLWEVSIRVLRVV